MHQWGITTVVLNITVQFLQVAMGAGKGLSQVETGKRGVKPSTLFNLETMTV